MKNRDMEKRLLDKPSLKPEEEAALQDIAQRIGLQISRDIATALGEMLVFMRSGGQSLIAQQENFSQDRILTADEMARFLKISKTKAYQMMRRKEIPSIAMGRTVRIRREDLESFIKGDRTA